MVFFSLGTNLGNKKQNLTTAIQLIAEKVGDVITLSSTIETEPWGFSSENTFLNMVIVVDTNLPPLEILRITQDIEKSMGRSAKTQNSYQDRLIDIDLILYDNLIFNSPELTLPHPLFHQRDFVLKPLCEIAPEYIHPILGKPIKEL